MSDRRSGIVIALFALLTACRQDMHDQPAYRPLMKSTFFTDARSARPVVEGTIARGQLRTDRAYYTGVRERPGTAGNTTSEDSTGGPGSSKTAAACRCTQVRSAGSGQNRNCR